MWPNSKLSCFNLDRAAFRLSACRLIVGKSKVKKGLYYVESKLGRLPQNQWLYMPSEARQQPELVNKRCL